MDRGYTFNADIEARVLASKIDTARRAYRATAKDVPNTQANAILLLTIQLAVAHFTTIVGPHCET